MKKDYTHINVILDRSGSMESIKDDIVGGFNSFLTDQQGEDNFATLSLIQFDSRAPYEKVHHFRKVEQVPKLDSTTFVPRASTPLLDALGRGINDLQAELDKLPEDERPEQIVFLIVTDGMENDSSEFTKAQVKKMLAAKTEADWQFVFLSADMDAVEEARGLGVKHKSSAHYSRSGRGAVFAFEDASESIKGYRSKVSKEINVEKSKDKDSE